MDAHTFNRQLKRLASDKRALEALYAEYALPMKAHLLRRFGSLVSAEDVTQDVFVKLLSLRDPPRVEYPASWLYTLADNRAKDILRATHPEAALVEGLAAPFDLDRTIVNAQTRRALEALDEDVRRIAGSMPAGAALSALGLAARAERDVQFNTNPAQAAFMLYLRVNEEKRKWQKLS